MRTIFEGLGVTWPTCADWVSVAAAAVFVGLAWIAAWFAGSRIGPRLARFWEHRAGARAEGVASRMCALSRYLVFSAAVGLVLYSDAWRPLAAIALGISLAASATLLVWGFLRGLQVPQWVAALLAGVTFAAIAARAVGGLRALSELLDRIGFDAGATRISLLTILQVLITAAALYAVVKLLNRFVSHAIKRASGLDATQQLLAQKLSAVAIVTVAFFIGIDLVGIDLTALAVFSGAFGLAVGFGLQKTFGNLIAGIILLMDRSIKPGDVIVVGDSFGHVTKIGVRAVSIVTRDGKEHLIPNENLMTQEVENWS
ncbi:MAG TPA: mechanosensitive ion channel domain-containing protein, partial [Allosphingosinicella sp.]